MLDHQESQRNFLPGGPILLLGAVEKPIGPRCWSGRVVRPGFAALAKSGLDAVIIALPVSAPAPRLYGAGRDAALPGMPIPCPVSIGGPVPCMINPQPQACGWGRHD